MPTVHVIKVWHTETVEIHWCVGDSQMHIERVTCPPKAVREARDRPTPDSLPDATGHSGDIEIGPI
jgi:hypothetical protein